MMMTTIFGNEFSNTCCSFGELKRRNDDDAGVEGWFVENYSIVKYDRLSVRALPFHLSFAEGEILVYFRQHFRRFQ